MSKTFIDKACAVVPNLENCISLFHKKLRLAQYAEQSIHDYKLKIAQAALYLQKSEAVCEEAFLRGQPQYALNVRNTLSFLPSDDSCR